MSQATDLLNSLTDDQISAYSSNAGEEPHIVIGDDRFIKVPESLKRIAVQYDHNVETVTFDCPRYWDDLDMSEMIVYINYMLPNKEKSCYIAENITADGDIMHFTWTISSAVTRNPGQIAFLVCIKKTGTNADGDPIEINHWNSELCTDCYISEGMECDVTLDMEYPDIVTQLLERMTVVERAESQMKVYLADAESAKSGAQTAASEAAANATVSLEAKDEVLEASDEIRNSYAPAIKGNVKGEIIRVDDVSPIEHDVKCWVHGKNLFDGNLRNGYLVDTSLRMTEVASSVYRTIIVNLKPGTYTLSSNVQLLILRIVKNGRYFNAGPTGTTYTFDIENEGVFGISFRTDPSADWNDSTELQIEHGEVATAYEPWTDLSDIRILACGKNIINYDLMPTTLTNNGVTVTRDGDILTFSGTATSDIVLFNTQFGHYGKTGNKYALSYNYLGGGVSGTATLCIGDSNSPDTDRNSWANIPLKTNECGAYTWPANKDYIKDMWFYCKAGVNFTSFKIQVQLERSDNATEYETFHGGTYIPDADGTINVTSVSPTTTLIPYTSGVTIEAEYNRDTTKMFESYVLTDEAKSQIAKEVEEDMAEVLASLNSYAASLTGGGN